MNCVSLTWQRSTELKNRIHDPSSFHHYCCCPSISWSQLSALLCLLDFFTNYPSHGLVDNGLGVDRFTFTFVGEWSEDSIELLQSLAASPMIMKVVDAPSSGGTISVELTPRSQGASVADTLVAEKFAQRRKSEAANGAELSTSLWRDRDFPVGEA